MANKVLTAKVKVDSSQAEHKLKRLAELFKGINDAVSKTSTTSKLETAISKQAVATEKLKLATAKVAKAEEQLAQSKLKTSNMTAKNKLVEEQLAQSKLRTASIEEKNATTSLLNEQKLDKAIQQRQLREEKLAQSKLRTNQMAANQIAKEEAQVDKLLAKEMNALAKKQQAKWKQFQAEQVAYEKELARAEAIKRKELEKERIRQQSLKTIGEGDKAAQRLARSLEQGARVKYQNIWEAQMALQQTHPILSRLVNKMAHYLENTKKVTAEGSRLNSVFNRTHPFVERIKNAIGTWVGKIKSATNANRQFNSSLASANQLASSLGSKMHGLISAYLGVMTGRAAITTADNITSAENKISYINAQQMGTTMTDPKVLSMTQDSMDKMYQSAQRVRTSYADMMKNVSKTMTLAPDAFQGNIDNAIRFQEIMAESYALGGASAEEMSSSMYQLTQALGSGILQGDELRSLREGAPLAYKAIEQFAQGVYNTTDSLKEMGSQGKITSDMVVAAVMNAGEQMDNAFTQTSVRFSEAWNQIKNVAIKAFSPIAHMLRDMLNDAMDSGLIKNLESTLTTLSKGIMIVLQGLRNVFTWIADNWSWLEGVIFSGITTIIGLLLTVKTISIITFMIQHAGLMMIVGAIWLVIFMLYQWVNGAISTTQLIGYAFIALGIIILLVVAKITLGWLVGLGVMTAGTAWAILAIIAIVLVLLYFAFQFFEQVCGGAMWLLAVLCNIASYIVSFIMACIYSLAVIIQWIVAFTLNLIMACANAIGVIVQWICAFIVNLAMGVANAVVAFSHNAVAMIINYGGALWNSLSAVAQNIGIAFQNAWIWAKNTFWEFVADVLSGVAKLEPVINGLAKLIGKDGINISGAVGTAKSKASGGYKDFVSVSNAWSSGLGSVQYKDIGSAWSSGWNTMKYANMGDMVSKGWNSVEYASISDAWSKGWNVSERVDPMDFYDKGANWGANVKNNINDWGSGVINSIKDKVGSKLNTSDIGKKLGLDVDKLAGANGFNNPNAVLSPDKYGGAGGAGGFDPSKALGDINKGVGGTKDNTGKIADEMDLTQEDLAYLRDVANMEWKKEFTTASITVDMSNYNTINGKDDLDGIVTRLVDKLYEELDSVANGVYA